MGGKQSTVGEVSIIQTPVTESIQDAYKAGDISKAQELIKLSCEETALQVEKVGLGYYSFSNFIGKETKMPNCCLLSFLMQKICSLISYACSAGSQTLAACVGHLRSTCLRTVFALERALIEG